MADACPISESNDERPANEMLPLVYDELRLLARHKMANEAPGKHCRRPPSFTKPICAS